MVGINPIGILLIPVLGIFFAAVVPAICLPWKGFVAYAGLAITTAMSLWYLSSYDSSSLKVCFWIFGIALLIGWFFQRLRQRHAKPMRPRRLSTSALLLVAPITCVISIEFIKFAWHKSKVPLRYAEAHATYLPRKVFTQCEVSVWQLASTASAPQIASENWSPTPYLTKPESNESHDAWLNGVGCSAVSEGTKNEIIDALNSPGSMYKSGPESGLLLIPSRGYVVHSYNHP